MEFCRMFLAFDENSSTLYTFYDFSDTTSYAFYDLAHFETIGKNGKMMIFGKND